MSEVAISGTKPDRTPARLYDMATALYRNSSGNIPETTAPIGAYGIDRAPMPSETPR
ncbi:hypothetical protein [Streptomyces sp. KL116D]|uniref:hypothetical protein n=1 Tax=Streptomyces sp. KL116D TaxID=3045152 RepID=UPI003558C135